MSNLAYDTIQTDGRFSRTRQLLVSLDKLTQMLPESDRAMVSKARDLSLAVHLEDKDRLDGQPYVNHPLEVALKLAERFSMKTPDFLAAALLHDSVEDGPAKIISYFGEAAAPKGEEHGKALDILKDNFSEACARLVARITNPDFNQMINAATAEGDTRDHDQMFIDFYTEHFLEIFDSDSEAFLIKWVDFSENAFKLSNVPKPSTKAWLLLKYGATIRAIREKLVHLPDEGHLISPFKIALIEELDEVYARDYR